jgi:hypothetical protein
VTPSLLLADAGPTAAASFSPASIAGLERQFDAAQISGVSVDATPVASWTDLSGNAAHATQAVGAAQPLYKTNIINGLPVVRFDGVDDRLQSIGLTARTARTAFVVAIRRGGTGYLMGLGSDQAAFQIDQGAGTTWTYRLTQASGAVTLGSNAAFAVLAVRWNTTSSADVFYNNGAGTNFDPIDAYSTATTLELGNESAGFGQVDVGYGLCYDSALSNPNIVLVQNWLGARFGLF